jgi:hypothetical protein
MKMGARRPALRCGSREERFPIRLSTPRTAQASGPTNAGEDACFAYHCPAARASDVWSLVAVIEEVLVVLNQKAKARGNRHRKGSPNRNVGAGHYSCLRLAAKAAQGRRGRLHLRLAGTRTPPQRQPKFFRKPQSPSAYIIYTSSVCSRLHSSANTRTPC